MVSGRQVESGQGPIRYGMVGGGQGAFIGGVHRLAARRKGGKPAKDVIYPTVEDGVEGVAFVEACVRSSKKNGAWTKL